ncbi:hypothetical protein BC628DRAFT_903261 [Trametes gibbosa]|nr:hypothetical protein BC628DRAFT_903261 [Trametes gibbosa]
MTTSPFRGSHGTLSTTIRDASFQITIPHRCGSDCRRPTPCPVLALRVASRVAQRSPTRSQETPQRPRSEPPGSRFPNFQTVFFAILSVTWKRPRLEFNETDAPPGLLLGLLGEPRWTRPSEWNPMWACRPSLQRSLPPSSISLRFSAGSLCELRSRRIPPSHTRHSDCFWRIFLRKGTVRAHRPDRWTMDPGVQYAPRFAASHRFRAPTRAWSRPALSPLPLSVRCRQVHTPQTWAWFWWRSGRSFVLLPLRQRSTFGWGVEAFRHGRLQGKLFSERPVT